MSKNILIIGYGTVGQNLYKTIQSLEPDIYDKYTHLDNRKRQYMPYKDEKNPDIKVMTLQIPKYDLAFICVDTPLGEDGRLDTTEVVNALKEHDAAIYVIKSTCPLGTVDVWATKTGKRIVYSPEYYGATPHCNNFDFNFTILGGKKGDCIEVQRILQTCYDARHTFHITDSYTAELVKFMENSWLATKVSFCNQFYTIAEGWGVNYEELRELFILDPRVNPSHTFVFPEHPYWDTHCLNKDVAHIANSEEHADLLKAVIEFNSDQKDTYSE